MRARLDLVPRPRAVHRAHFGTALWLLLSPLTLWAAEPPASLRDVLSAEEFQRAGLEKLTAEELEFLSLRVRPTNGPTATPVAPPAPSPTTPTPTPVAAPMPAPAPAATPALRAPAPPAAASDGEAAFGREEQIRVEAEQTQRAPKILMSRISGAFRGWDGHTVFRLENGQVWHQADTTTFHVKLENPAVRIERAAFGTYLLSVEGYGSRVRVRRAR